MKPQIASPVVTVLALAGIAVQTTTLRGGSPSRVFAAQKPAEAPGQSCPWPASLDAVQAAPQIHKVIFENEHVRVLQVTIPPHTREPIHTHCLPGTLYIQQAGDIIDRDDQGKILFDSRQLKEKPKAPFVQWSAREAPHSIENLAAFPLKLVRVENKN